MEFVTQPFIVRADVRTVPMGSIRKEALVSDDKGISRAELWAVRIGYLSVPAALIVLLILRRRERR